MKNDLPLKYFVNETDENGEVEFNIGLGGCNNGTLTVSYEKYNYKPYQDNTFTVP